MPDQLEHALRRRTELQASRSKPEVAAINTLERAYELLLSRELKSNYSLQPGRIRRPQSARLRASVVSCITKHSNTVLKAHQALSGDNCEGLEVCQQDDSELLATYASLVQLINKLSATGTELEAEVATSERKCRVLQADPSSFLQPVDLCDLSPRLQALHSVLGLHRFQQYRRDLYTEVAQLKRRAWLYGDRYGHFMQEIAVGNKETIDCSVIGAILEKWDRSSTDKLPVNQVIDAETLRPPLYLLVFQHCEDPRSPGQLLIKELDILLSSMPEPREKLARHTFEQLADGWRGEGYAPPPDTIRSHRLYAAVKESFSHQQCSPTEYDAVAAWINTLDVDGSGNTPVSLQSFLEFHHSISDEFPLEDAEFIRYLLRIWCFDPSTSLSTALRSDRDAVARVILSSDERSIHERLMARKRELINKIDSAQSGIDSRAQQLRVQLGSLQQLEVKTPTLNTWWSDSQFAEHLGESLAGLRALVAPGYALSSFPAFLNSLSQLETLDLHDNRVALIPSELGLLKTLRRLNLAANCLTDASFADSTTIWDGMKHLQELVLHGNQLTFIPKQFANLKSLQKLDVGNNAIRSVHRSLLNEWSKTPRLVVLDLHHNALSSLPEEIGELQELRHLLLHDNTMTSLPVSIASLQKLEELTLTGNRLGKNFREFPVTDAQNRIALDRNLLREFPLVKAESKKTGSSSNFPNIVSISAARNQLRSFPMNPVTIFAACKELRLQHNAIQELPEAFFEALPLLEELVLHNNRLVCVPESIVQCKFIRAIDMHSNRIVQAPAAMVGLSKLEILDLTDNALQSVPVVWHEFNKHTRDTPVNTRVLQTLALRRNPIRNSVLKAVINGCCRDGSFEGRSVFTSDSDRVCEGVIRKLIAGLRDAAAINAAFDCASSDSEKASGELEESHGRCKWRGVTRDVNRHLSQRLRRIQRRSNGDSSKRLTVEAKSFKRMIKSLPFACSRLELAALVKRLNASSAEKNELVDGDAFLEDIDSFGRSGMLSTAATSPRRARSESTGDTAAPILHYLSIIHRQQLNREEGKLGQNTRAEIPKSSVPPFKEKKKVSKGSLQAPNHRTPPLAAKKANQDRPEAASSAFVSRMRTGYRVSELERQRQRVEVLKQQLMDHKLLLLHESKHTVSPPIASTVMDVGSDPELDCDLVNDKCEASDDTRSCISDIVHVCVSLPTAEASRLAFGADHLEIRIDALQTVVELKQRIEALAHILVGDQILVARIRGQQAGIRLNNASTIQQSVCGDRYRISEKKPWHLLLLLRHGV